MTMPGRSYTYENYRFGFNGMEKDDDIAQGDLDFGARIYDSRLGRWLSVDPLQEKYPNLSTYNYTANNPILFKDPDGQKIFIYFETGKVDKDGTPIIESYEYNSGIKPPKDKFVKKTIRTLNKTVNKGYDSYGVIDKLSKDEDNHVAITKLDNWNSSAYIVEVGKAIITDFATGEVLNNNDFEFPPDEISWSPNSGLISPDGKERQSAANSLLHEIAHKFYQLFDPDGMKEENKDLSAEEEYEKMRKETGDYHTYSDKWIIENVEVGFKKEWNRKNHSEGYFLKTKGGTFSSRGKIYGRWGLEGKTKDLKKGNPIKKP